MGYQQMHIEVGSFQKFSTNDCIVVGSDGLFDNVTLSHAVRESTSQSPTDLCEYFMNSAEQNMS